jgi:hypothetical protein
MALLGSLVVIGAQHLRKQGGVALLVGKVLLVWVAHGVMWVVFAWFLHEIIPLSGVSLY